MQQNDNVCKLACLLQVINMHVHFVELLTFTCYRIRFSGCLYNLVVLHIWQAIIARRDLYFNLQIKVFIYLQSGLCCTCAWLSIVIIFLFILFVVYHSMVAALIGQSKLNLMGYKFTFFRVLN